LQKLTESQGFTESYQQDQITQDNVTSRKKRAPVTDNKYARAVNYWILSILSKGLPEDHYFKPDNPSLPIQMLKLFPERYTILRESNLPS
ncbi:hypothetical protein BO85DRAFT_356693, partial [Aspergillus piperis CBS 112811]